MRRNLEEITFTIRVPLSIEQEVADVMSDRLGRGVRVSRRDTERMIQYQLEEFLRSERLLRYADRDAVSYESAIRLS